MLLQHPTIIIRGRFALSAQNRITECRSSLAPAMEETSLRTVVTGFSASIWADVAQLNLVLSQKVFEAQ